MSMINVHRFDQPQSGGGKGLCLRLAVKWATTHLCGGTQTALLSDEAWIEAKTAKNAIGGSKGYQTYKQNLESFGSEELQKELLSKRPTFGVEYSRWQSTKTKQAEYAKAVETAEAKRGDVHAVDLACIQRWASQTASRHKRTIAVQQRRLDNLGNWLGLALQNNTLQANATFVLGCDFASEKMAGGHALAYSDPTLFDPNGGLFQSDMGAAAFRFFELDQYILSKYGQPLGVVCYVLTLG